MTENNGAVVEPGVDLAAQLEVERIARQQAEDRARVAEEVGNTWKDVGLRRKGKLEGDDNFFGDHDVQDVEKVVEQKRLATLKDIETQRAIETEKARALAAEKKLEEVLRAKDLKPESGVGSASGGGQEVKDGIFSAAQEADMKARWTHRGYTPEQQARMLDTEKKNALARRNIS